MHDEASRVAQSTDCAEPDRIEKGVIYEHIQELCGRSRLDIWLVVEELTSNFVKKIGLFTLARAALVSHPCTSSNRFGRHRQPKILHHHEPQNERSPHQAFR